MDINLAAGCTFLAVVSGIGSFFGIIGTCCAFSDRERYAVLLAVVTGIAIIVFLVSGFMGFALTK